MAEGAPALSSLRVRSVSCTPVQVPLRYVLGTSAATVKAAPLLLVDLLTEEGVAGRSYVFAYRRSGARAIAALLEEAVELVRGDAAAPLAIAAKLQRRFALIGVTGVARMALSALDMALWDALAVAAGVPLTCLLGGAPRPVRAYNSCGLGLMAPQAAADEAEALLEGGLQAVKLRLGYPTLAEDLAVTRAVRRRLPDTVQLMVDYNQALSRVEALERGRALQSEGVAWLEEPIRQDDLGQRAGRARPAAAAATGRELRWSQGLVACAAGRGLRPRDARRRAHRRGQRLDAGGGNRGSPRHSHEFAPDAGGQCPPAGRHADLPLAGIRGLDRRDRGRAGEDPRRLLADRRGGGHRAGLGRGKGGALAHRMRRATCR